MRSALAHPEHCRAHERLPAAPISELDRASVKLINEEAIGEKGRTQSPAQGALMFHCVLADRGLNRAASCE